jgi:tRNA A-37 threonylcarbamoyl transferase component Bud32
MSTWSGKSLGNVLIGELIARGGMAEVYYGKHSTLNRNVAVKIMRDHVEEDPDSRARFAREARVVAGLDHPNIIQIFDSALVDGRPCIVMELVPGASLGNYLKELHKRGEKLSHSSIAHLLKPIAAAMDYAHDRNIVHRDIKPANILLRSKNGQVIAGEPLPEDVEPVLTDFGLVRLLDSTTQTSTGTVSGTPSYMSPEQARGDRVDRRTDIYSLGVVLYEMLAGEVPFDAESSFGVLMKHLNDPPPPIVGISKDLQAVINRALAKDPAHRYDSAGELVNEFEAVLSGKKLSEKTDTLRDIVAKAASPAQPVAAPSRLPILVGGAIVLALIVIAGIWLIRPSFMPGAARLEPNQPVGHIAYNDFNYLVDQVIVSVNGLPLPEPGTHFEVWMLSQGGEKRRSIGSVTFDGNSGQLNYINPDGDNLLAEFDQFEITLEPNDDDPAPSNEVVASSIFPPLVLPHMRHLLVSIGSTPEGIALIQGLWDGADTINTSVQELRDGYSEDDEETVRLKTEEIINQLAGDKNLTLYKDWNENGSIDDPMDGYGLLMNGESTGGTEQGYIPQTLHSARLAAESADATRSILDNHKKLNACIFNMEKWSRSLLDLALQLQGMPYGPEMEAVITEMELLSSRLVYGEDANGNGRIEPIPEEGGADTAYVEAYLMANMPLLPGPNRIPPPASSQPGTTTP